MASHARCLIPLLTFRGVCQQRVPLVEAQVAVSELFQQRPLDDAFRGSVLKEIDKSVLQAGVLLWCGLLLGELVQTRVLLVESLADGDGRTVFMQHRP